MDSEKYLISVIIPVYNVEPYLRKCIDSVIGQTYTNLEILLVDDGSTDCSGAICDEYQQKDNRVRVFHKENGGLSSARNVALDEAHGDYIGFVDSDDYIDSSMFEVLIELCINYDCAFSCIDFMEIRAENANVKNDSVMPVKLCLEDFLRELICRDSQYHITYCVWSKLFKKSIIQNIYFPEGKCYEDVAFVTHAILNAGDCVFLGTQLYSYVIRQGSISKSKYKDGFDRRLITDRLPQQIEQVKYLSPIVSSGLTNIIKAEYYEDLFNYYVINKDEDLEKPIKDALEQWTLSIRELSCLPYNKKRRLVLIAKMHFRQSCAYAKKIRTKKVLAEYW